MTVPGSQVSLMQQQAGFAHTGSPRMRNTWQGQGAVPAAALQLCGLWEECMHLSEEINNSSKSNARCYQVHTFSKACQYPHLYGDAVHCGNADRRGSAGRGPADPQEEQKELCWMLIKESKALVVLSSSVRKPCLSVNKNRRKPCLLFVFSCKRIRSWHLIKCLESI